MSIHDGLQFTCNLCGETQMVKRETQGAFIDRPSDYYRPDGWFAVTSGNNKRDKGDKGDKVSFTHLDLCGTLCLLDYAKAEQEREEAIQ